MNAVESMEKVRTHIVQVYNRYKEEFGYHQINIFISENACNHIIRIHRVLTFTQKYVVLVFIRYGTLLYGKWFND